MTRVLAGLLAVVACAQTPGPPLVIQVVNAASQMPAVLPGGRIARGSQFLIRGFRFGEHPSVRVDAVPVRILSASETEIKAIAPLSVPSARARLTVTRAGTSSRPFDVNVVSASFGIGKAERKANTVILTGTGLGNAKPEVRVAGKAVQRVRVTRRRQGIEEIRFELPQELRQACHVPVVVRTDPESVSNVATIRNEPCANGNWLAGRLSSGKQDTIALGRAIFEVETNSPSPLEADVLMARLRGDGADMALIDPPLGACTGYAGSTTLPELAAVLKTEPRAVFTVRGPGGARRIQGSGLLGGSVPYMKRPAAPLFLRPGEYTVSSGYIQARITVQDPLPLPPPQKIQLGRPFTVEWSGAGDDLLLVVLANLDLESGAIGVCTCLTEAAAGRFTIPGESLANIPVSSPSPILPPGALVMIKFPRREPAGPGVGMGLTGRSVEFEPARSR